MFWFHVKAQQPRAGICCTYCESPVAAVKTCLQCEVSFCEKHLQAHNMSVEHTLTAPTNIKSRKCTIHGEILKYHCSDDAACVCVSCFVIGEHKGHNLELLDDASKKKKIKLRNAQEKLTKQSMETDKSMKELQRKAEEVLEKAAGITERVTASFRDIRGQLDVLEKRILSEVIRQKQQASLRVTELIQQLEIKKRELTRKVRQLEALCNMTDPITVLQMSELVDGDLLEENGQAAANINRDNKELPAVDGLDEDSISLTLHRGLADMMTDLKTKSGFNVKEDADILLDIYTANQQLSLSDDLKTATCPKRRVPRQRAPERFVDCCQALSTKRFSAGKHYWEVETCESFYWYIGVAYASIDRRGRQSVIGYNNKSWCLTLVCAPVSVMHNSEEEYIDINQDCRRFGVFLDYDAGRLSFYQLCDPIRHLHTFNATFTEPLHAAFLVNDGSIRITS